MARPLTVMDSRRALGGATCLEIAALPPEESGMVVQALLLSPALHALAVPTLLGPTWPDGVDISFGKWQKLALARGFMRATRSSWSSTSPRRAGEAPEAGVW